MIGLIFDMHGKPYDLAQCFGNERWDIIHDLIQHIKDKHHDEEFHGATIRLWIHDLRNGFNKYVSDRQVWFIDEMMEYAIKRAKKETEYSLENI